jgi:hypothetical protein
VVKLCGKKNLCSIEGFDSPDSWVAGIRKEDPKTSSLGWGHVIFNVFGIDCEVSGGRRSSHAASNFIRERAEEVRTK